MSHALSGDAKDALARELPATPHCRNALRAGLARYGGFNGTFRTHRPAVARLYWTLLDDRKSHAIVKVPGRRLYRTPLYEIDIAPGDERRVPPRARCDRRMEIRAAFLACGSVAEPMHGYHLEFVPPSPEAAARLAAVLRADGHVPHEGVRKGKPLVYFKGVDAIVGVLTAIGAFGAVLHLEDVRALKETKNRIHRLVNTEAANVERAANAATVARETIAFIDDAYGLRKLAPHLREIAELRLRYPTETLAELGRRCRPAAKKSTVNSRLSTLARLALRLRSSNRVHSQVERSNARLAGT